MHNIQTKHIEAMRNLLFEEFGIHVSDLKAGNIVPKLSKLLLNEKYENADDFFLFLKKDFSAAKIIIAKYFTTNHTFFFREEDHFDFVLKDVVETKKTNIAIWSAASSTGEEAYSIAMTLLDRGIKDFKILASDLDKTVLKHFNEGEYGESRLSKVSEKQRKRYFIETKTGFVRVKNDLRKHIFIKNLNLMDDLAFEKQFDYIFCRNVFIYFNDRSRFKTLEMLSKNLKLGGYIFVGHTESLFNLPPNLKKVENSIFKKIS